MCKVMNELEATVKELRSLKAMKEELENEIKSLENDVIEYLNTNNKTSEVGKDFSIKYTECSRTTLDKNKLIEKFGDLSAFEKVSTYHRLTVK